jgi:hypothetical protein
MSVPVASWVPDPSVYFGRLQGFYAETLYFTSLTAIMLVGAAMVVSDTAEAWRFGLRTIVLMTIATILATELEPISTAIHETMVYAAGKAGGLPENYVVHKAPERVLNLMFQLVANYFDKCLDWYDPTTWMSAIYGIVLAIVILALALVIFAAVSYFFFMFKMEVLTSFILTPFITIKQTAFYWEDVPTKLMNSGLQFFFVLLTIYGPAEFFAKAAKTELCGFYDLGAVAANLLVWAVIVTFGSARFGKFVSGKINLYGK